MADFSVALHNAVSSYIDYLAEQLIARGMVAKVDKGLSLLIRKGSIKYWLWVQVSRSGKVSETAGGYYAHRIYFTLYRDWYPMLSEIKLPPELTNLCEIVRPSQILISGDDIAGCVESFHQYDSQGLIQFIEKKTAELTRPIY